MPMNTWIQQLPKAELHLHIEGSLEPELLFALAQRNHIQLPYDSIEALTKAYSFENLQSFLDLYYAGASVLQTEEDFYDLTWAYLMRCVEDHVRHVEIFFDPQTHTVRGIAYASVHRGILRALQTAQTQYGISYRLILSFLRHLSEEDGLQTLEEALPYLDEIDGFGLDSSELGHPPSKFSRLFAKCRSLNKPVVAHAGEEGPPAYIWEALQDLQVQRIDHGVRCLEDATLVQYLQEKQIPLTVCPLSNIKLKVFERMQDHPLAKMLDLGLLAMINSDDPAYFGGYLAQNYQDCAQALHLSPQTLALLAKNSFKASFLSEPEKQAHYASIDQHLQALDPKDEAI